MYSYTHLAHAYTHTLFFFLSFFLCYCDQKQKEKLFPSLILYASHLHPASLIFANIINNKLSMSHPNPSKSFSESKSSDKRITACRRDHRRQPMPARLLLVEAREQHRILYALWYGLRTRAALDIHFTYPLHCMNTDIDFSVSRRHLSGHQLSPFWTRY